MTKLKSLHMLDTNIVSHIIKGDDPGILKRLPKLQIGAVIISSVTEAELLYGLIKRGSPSGLTNRIHEFLTRVEVLPWDRQVAVSYAKLRTACEAKGVSLGDLDMMIAAHAVATHAILVTRDKAFKHLIPHGLKCESWTA